jgi:hypothetical protein
MSPPSGPHEADWQTLRELKPQLLDRLCAQILDEAAQVIGDDDSTAHARFLALYRLILDRNDDVAVCFDDLRRTTLLPRLLAMHRRGLLREDELARFSAKMQDSLQALLRQR